MVENETKKINGSITETKRKPEQKNDAIVNNKRSKQIINTKEPSKVSKSNLRLANKEHILLKNVKHINHAPPGAKKKFPKKNSEQKIPERKTKISSIVSYKRRSNDAKPSYPNYQFPLFDIPTIKIDNLELDTNNSDITQRLSGQALINESMVIVPKYKAPLEASPKPKSKKTNLEKSKSQSRDVIQHLVHLSEPIKDESTFAGFKEDSVPSSSKFTKRLSLVGERRKSRSSVSTIIPTTGSALLEWTKNQMSFTSQDESVESDETDSLLTLDGIKSRTKSLGSRIMSRISSPSFKSKSHMDRKKSMQIPDKTSDLNVKNSLEDDVLFQWRIRNADKPDGLINYPLISADLSLRKKSASAEKFRMFQKKSTPFPKFSTLLWKKEQERKHKLEREKRKRHEVYVEQTLARQQQDKEEEELRKEKNRIELGKIRKLHSDYIEIMQSRKEEANWQHFSNCIKIPQVTESKQLEAFVDEWERFSSKMNIQEFASKSNINLEMLNELQDLICLTPPEDSVKIDQWNWSTNLLRNIQEQMLDSKVYKLLSDIHKNLSIENLDFGKYNYKTDEFSIHIWLKLDWPVSLPNPKKPPTQNINIPFPEIKANIELPSSLTGQRMAVECLHLFYDHMSDSSENSRAPPKQDYMTKDILECNEFDRFTRLKYDYESFLREEYLKRVKEFKTQYGNTTYPRAFVFPNIALNDDIPPVPPRELTPSADEYLQVCTDMEYEESIKQMIYTVEENVINLRQYHIVGGVFHIYLIYHPPQPQALIRHHMTINRVKLPRKLEYVPFYAEFNPPEVPTKITVHRTLSASRSSARGKRSDRSRMRRVVEDEINSQEYQELMLAWENTVALAKQKMIRVTLGLPEGAIYLDHPLVCLWDKNINVWKVSDVHDVAYNYENRTVSFKTCRFGVFGLAVKRHINLPYYSWDIRPNIDDSIAIILQGEKITVHLVISKQNIKLTSVKHNLPNFYFGTYGLDKYLDQSMTLCRFVRILTSSGLDLFPGHDAHCYYTATNEKHWAMSYLTYYSMARMAIRYNFSRSKWNTKVSRRSIVMQVREYNPSNSGAASRSFSLIQVTPSKCEPLLCKESTEDFTDSPLPSTVFQPNLYRLLNSTLGTSDRAKIKVFSKKTIYTLSQFLVLTRLFSFS